MLLVSEHDMLDGIAFAISQQLSPRFATLAPSVVDDDPAIDLSALHAAEDVVDVV